MSEKQTPDEIKNEIDYYRSRCAFVDKGVPGCLLKFRPDLTEQDNDGIYYHATCGKTWQDGHYDAVDSDPSIEDEQCYAHPVFDEYGETLGDWG